MSHGKRILIADDEERIVRVLESALSGRGFDVRTAADGNEAISSIDHEQLDVIITDLKMPGRSGHEILEHVGAMGSSVPVIIITAYGTVESAISAMKAGAFDYVTKPFNLDEIEVIVDRALRSTQLVRANQFLSERDRTEMGEFCGRSKSAQVLLGQIERVAASDATVLISGETGTGKELVARSIHSLGSRQSRLFVPINCAAIPRDLLESELFGHVRGSFSGATKDRPGKFEVADGGTIFLDEIGEMPIDLQVKILRALEEGTVSRVGSNVEVSTNVRVVSATNRHLGTEIAKGRFREDLYYRLNVVELAVPPLRERREDIRPLAERFLGEFAVRNGRVRMTIDAEAVTMLEAYSWPGNVRELRNICERLVVLTDGNLISPENVDQIVYVPYANMSKREPGDGGSNLSLVHAVEEAEISAVNAALERENGSVSGAARSLGIGERTLWYKFKKYGNRIER